MKGTLTWAWTSDIDFAPLHAIILPRVIEISFAAAYSDFASEKHRHAAIAIVSHGVVGTLAGRPHWTNGNGIAALNPSHARLGKG
jgi:hypothetical protein